MNNNLLVLQSDFGLVDGAVSAMIGVALEESPTLKIHHLTHDITPYNIFEGSYRLFQTVNYWPEGTTFVSVVDPGVGSKRKSVVAKTAKNQYIVTPDNGTLSFIKKHVGIVTIREISEVANRRQSILILSTVVMFMPILVLNWPVVTLLLRKWVLSSVWIRLWSFQS